MPPTIKTLDAFKVAGIALRTINRNGQSQKDISELWQRFSAEKLIEKIPAKKKEDIYCIYTDYESDFTGYYTCILGCKVSSAENIPELFISKTIPATTYIVYESAGKLPECVVQTWMDIWQSELKRKYKADFDIYGEKAHDPENAVVETYVSINI